MKTYNLKKFLQFVTILSAVGLFSAAQAAAIVVNLEVNDSQTKLVATTKGTCISGNNTPGCVHASGQVQINFNLTGNTTCTLDHVAIGDPGNISEVAAKDFNADMSSGLVSPISQNDRHILIRDNNTAVYDIAYTVYAQCNGVLIDSDPRVENDGSGHP
ncbi:MAG: hypothetical protein WBS20_16760 [Lysobacterales bacterium]